MNALRQIRLSTVSRLKNYSRKILKGRYIVVGVLLFAAFFLVPDAMAQVAGTGQPDLGLRFAAETGLGTTDIRTVIARIIRIAFGLLGIIAVSIVVYGGFMYMTSGGDQGKVSTARKILINGSIGLAIILSAFGITEFVIRAILGQSGTGVGGFTSGTGTTGSAAGGGFSGGALGRVIRVHYPDRNETGVARNTKVLVTFADKINPATIFDTNKKNQVNINADNIKIYKKSDAKSGGLPPEKSKLITDITVQTTDDFTFSFAFKNYLGSPSQDVTYVVYIGAGVQRSTGSSLFAATGSYSWEFTTGTTLDLVPPQVTSVTPINQGLCPKDLSACSPRNEIVQINFNEAMDPTTVSGATSVFNFIEMKPKVAGEFLLSNGYKTVTFIPTSGCGGVKENSCGDPIFCLPGGTKFEVTLRAAGLDPTQAGTAQAATPYTGIVDLAGNSLDGQQANPPNGTAEGAPKDNYAWEFHTNNNLDIVPPKLLQVTPDVNTSKVPLNQPIEMHFDKPMLSSSLYGGFEFFYGISTKPSQRDPWLGAQVLEFVSDAKGKVDPKKVQWRHYDPLQGSTAKQTYYFYPTIYSTIQDTRQNCFKPSEGPVNTKQGLKCESLGNRWKSTKVGTYPNCDLTR